MKTFVLTPAGWRPGGGTRRSGSHRQSDLQPHVDVAAHASSDAPSHTGPHGLPVGAKVIGPLGMDDRLLAIAAWMHARLG